MFSAPVGERVTVAMGQDDQGAGMPMSNADRSNVLPLVTICDDASDPAAHSFDPSMIAQYVASSDVPVDVDVIDPPVMAATVTLRPFGERAAGAPIVRPALLPTE